MYRKALNSSLIYASGILASKLVSFFLVPLYTHVLSQADYGVLELLDLTVQVVTMMLFANFPGALAFFHARASDEHEKAGVISTALWGALIVGGAAAVFGCLGAFPLNRLVFQSGDYTKYFIVLMIGFAFTVPLEVCLGWIRIIDRPIIYVLISMGRLVIQLSLNILLLVVFPLGLAAIPWSSMTSAFVIGSAVLVYGLYRNGVSFHPKLFKDMLAYATPMIFVGLALFAIHFGDRFVLQRYTSMEQIGLYALAYKLGMLVNLVHTAFQTYWGGQVFQIMKTPSGDHLFSRMFTYLVLILSAGGLVIVVSAEPLILTLTPPSYAGAIILVPWIGAAYVARSIGDHLRNIFYVENRPDMDAKVNAYGAIVAVAGYFILIPRYGVLGAALATFISFSVILALNFWWSQRLRHIAYESGRVMKAAVPAILLALVYLLAPLRQGGWPHLLLGVIVLTVYPVIVISSGFFEKREKEQAVLLWSSLKQRLVKTA